MNLVDELHRIAAALEGAGVRYAVCGGLAVTVHGAPRTTKDIDLIIDAEQVDAVLELLHPLGYRFRAAPMVFDRGAEAERTIQRVTRVEGHVALTLDLLVGHGYLEPILAGRRRVDLPRGPLWVVSRDGLGQMKRLAGRPQDLRDLELLGLADA